MAEEHILNVTDVQEIPFPIPGATPEGVAAKILNVDVAEGAPTNIIIIKAGATIPAHYHKNTAETHYVLEGDFINAGITYGPGSFFTHAAGVIHGPHGSKNGCSVLTIQPSSVDASDFYTAE